jgi:hypothetical protein
LKQAAPMMAIDHRLNADPFKINAKNGTFEVRRGSTDEDPIYFGATILQILSPR